MPSRMRKEEMAKTFSSVDTEAIRYVDGSWVRVESHAYGTRLGDDTVSPGPGRPQCTSL